jgi:hypothetical protein
MKKYSVIVSHDDDEYLWNVYEKETEQVIESYYFEEDAVSRARFMESGGAFDGFTPSFFLQEVSIPKEEVNEAFGRAFS